MRTISVNYLISDEEYARLVKITEGYKEQGVDCTPEEQFEFIMRMGSKYNIDNKFSLHERILGIKKEPEN